MPPNVTTLDPPTNLHTICYGICDAICYAICYAILWRADSLRDLVQLPPDNGTSVSLIYPDLTARPSNKTAHAQRSNNRLFTTAT